MKFTIITPCYQAETFIDRCVESVLRQRELGVELEYLVLDAGSTDGTLERLKPYAGQIDAIVSEPDAGPAEALNKGIARAGGDVIAWLNADDEYAPGTLKRVAQIFDFHPSVSFCFGHCPMINENDQEIRKPITKFKESFFPLSSRFTYQCINYLSQPACFFRKDAVRAAGPLRTDLKAAWDYDFILRVWKHGKAVHLSNPPLAYFRWHEGSISGLNFHKQFEEEFQAAKRDAGTFSPQTLIHWCVKWGIIGSYTMMNRRRRD